MSPKFLLGLVLRDLLLNSFANGGLAIQNSGEFLLHSCWNVSFWNSLPVQRLANYCYDPSSLISYIRSVAASTGTAAQDDHYIRCVLA